MVQTTVKRDLYQTYESKIENARIRFEQNSGFEEILTGEVDPRVLELYLIYFNALGVAMTDVVEDWISRAGDRCLQLGYTELGQLLKTHAQQEAGHHLMMIDDTHALVSSWNNRRTPQQDAQWFLSQPRGESTQLYRQLHEDVIASETPFAQVAIEYEIEMLSVRYGSQLIQRCQQVLGNSIIQGLSFMEEHVSVDVGHTQLNAKLLKNFLGKHPEHVDVMVEVGAKALDAYAGFLNHCLRCAQQHVLSLD
ncbi:hypothetical protein I8748_05085 [Nostoc sp. CENA67]|uniref:Iron-containing redox enzyme family protein n=1 Tax=Amazonocrinis nigriterrae CENA67 TaxID=2794033 RepID=A0A8J7L810_9NOST|nr:hypothetical protein [Amazonocrinis nigriterrae]MBH8561556.1 hypothetical protein [Amazonocrinis nigriterrae CENA67]MBH8561557.1 hypothetical protein [Amazonocrinis nigriterrae CENA67]